jgi:hypothetical protein
LKKYIRIETGAYRGEDQSGRVFPMVKEYQKYTGSKRGGFVTVDVTEQQGYEGLDKVRINIPDIAAATVVPEAVYVSYMEDVKSAIVPDDSTLQENDEMAIARIATRFEILNEMTEAVATNKVRAVIVSGPPGIGKSFGVESTLEKFSTFDDIAGNKRKFEMVKGAMSAIGLYKKLYEHKDPGHVVCFDDCDAILYDDLSLNLLKAALDSGKKRMLHWNTESRTLYQEGMPNSFEFHGGVIFISNIKFDNVKSKKLQDHLQALQSRCHYLDLTIDSMRDRMLRIKQICRQGMLERYAMTQEEQERLVAFIFENRNRLREVSLRMVLKIADLWRMAPDRYQTLAHQTCMKAGA